VATEAPPLKMYQSFPLNKICRYAEFFLCVGLAAVRLTHRFKAATPRRTTQLNEEKLCQLLANQTRALQKKRSQAASHAHHLPIKPLQSQASLRVPETVAQVQTSSQRKTGMAATAVIQVMVAQHVLVVQNSALQTPMPLALYAPRVHSLKLVLQKLMVTQVARHTATAMKELLAKTAVDTRVAQSVQAMVAMIVHLAVTVTHVLHTATAMTAVLVVETAQLMGKVATAGFLVMGLADLVQLPVVATLAK